jgi:molybdate transport system permease protein
VRRETRPRTPAVFAIPAIVAVGFIALPILGFLHRVPWSNLGELLTSSTTLDALRVSLVVSVSAALVAVLLGTPLAWVLAKSNIRGRSVLRALVLLPMVLPPVVGGNALLFALGRRGLVGQWLDEAFGITLPFTTAGAIVAASFVALPFYVITVEASLRQTDRRLEEAAATLGASRWYTFRRITVPAITPALLAGTALAWARALGEFGATITFAGNLQGRTQTLPLATFLSLEAGRPEEALALSLVLLVVSLAVLISLRDRWLIS